MTQKPFVVTAFYKFVTIADCSAVQRPLLKICQANDLFGTILLAPEGINGTIAGSRTGIEALLAHIRAVPGCADLEHKESYADTAPFYRMKVRLKREIVTMRQPHADPSVAVGQYVAAADWNQLIADPDVVVIDTRNDYEMGIGSFQGAIKPDIETFSEFPDWFRQQQALHNKKKIAMFCTGGIRCEKASAFLLSEGIDTVYHLKGGILKYLETIPAEHSQWEGECFVFDQRVSVGQGLKVGSYDQCTACKMPISAHDKASPHFVLGVSCPHCYLTTTEGQRQRFGERQKQCEKAKAAGGRHIGPTRTRVKS